MRKLIIFLIISFFSNKSFANTPSLENSTWKIFERGTTYDFNFLSGGNCTWGYVNLWYQTYSDCKWNQQGERFRVSLNNDYNIMEGYLNGPNLKGTSVSKNTFYAPAEFSGYAVFIDKYIIKEVPKPRAEPKVENNKVTEKYSPPKISLNEPLRGREKAKELFSDKFNSSIKAVLGAAFGVLVLFGIDSITGGRIEKKFNLKIAYAIAAFIGWMLTKFI